MREAQGTTQTDVASMTHYGPWLAHDGGPWKGHADALVNVRFEGGNENRYACEARHYQWERVRGGTITHYRVALAEPQEERSTDTLTREFLIAMANEHPHLAASQEILASEAKRAESASAQAEPPAVTVSEEDYLTAAINKGRDSYNAKNPVTRLQWEALKAERDNLASENARLREENAQLRILDAESEARIEELVAERKALRDKLSKYEAPSDEAIERATQAYIGSTGWIPEGLRAALKELGK